MLSEFRKERNERLPAMLTVAWNNLTFNDTFNDQSINIKFILTEYLLMINNWQFSECKIKEVWLFLWVSRTNRLFYSLPQFIWVQCIIKWNTTVLTGFSSIGHCCEQGSSSFIYTPPCLNGFQTLLSVGLHRIQNLRSICNRVKLLNCLHTWFSFSVLH